MAAPTRLRVFAVEDTTVQLTWRALPPGPRTLRVGEREQVVVGGRPGAASFSGLAPGTRHEVALDGVVVDAATTLPPAAGPERLRIATVSDVHIGETGFGLFFPMRERGQTVPYAERCLRAALAEAVAWGAQRLVVKGDLTQHGTRSEFERVAAILGSLPIPVCAVWGNHDVEEAGVDGRPILEAAGVEVDLEPTARQLPGLCLVTLDSTIATKHHGQLDGARTDAVARLLGASPTPALVAMHHQVQGRMPTYWPPGIVGRQGPDALDRWAAANPAALVTSGHTHRNRSRRHGPLVVTEVGSTKDHPGSWAGYVVHDGGIRQVVHRIGDPSVIAWTERSRKAAAHLWGRWSPGPLDQRCFSHPWPTRSAPPMAAGEASRGR